MSQTPMTPEEALVKARSSGVGPIFTESQLQRLSDWCRAQNVNLEEFVPAYTDYIIASFAITSSVAEMAAQVELAVVQVPDINVVMDLYQKKLKRRPSGEGPADRVKRRYRALEHEKLKAPSVQNFNETQLAEYTTVAHQAWQLYTSQLTQTVMKLEWSNNERQTYWDIGYAAFMICYRAITDRQAKLQTDKLQRRLDKMRAGAEKLIDIADNMPNGAQAKDFEKLIDDGNRQAEELKKLADETVDVEMLDLVSDMNKKLVFTTEKLKKTFFFYQSFNFFY